MSVDNVITETYHCEEKHWWFIGLRNIFLYYIFRISNGKCFKILDAGCGTGKNIETLKSMGHEIYGIDYSPEAIKFCRLRGINNIEIGDVTNIPFKDDYFDILYSFDVLICLEPDKLKKAISEFIRVTRKGGFILLNLAAFKFLWSPHDDAWGTKKRFIARDIYELFKDYNIKFVKMSYRVFLLFLPIVLVKFLKKIKGKFNKDITSDLYIPVKFLNYIFTKIQLFENKLIKKTNLPFGTSLFVVLQNLK
jgi:SAM-dependent methyltransferase